MVTAVTTRVNLIQGVWTQIADVQCILQKTDHQKVYVAYASAPPTGLTDAEELTTYKPRSFNAPVSGFLYATAGDRDTAITVTADGRSLISSSLKDEIGTSVIFDPLVSTIPTTDTFHHLGHEGMVFIHGERHDGIADGASYDILIRIPAGDADRQVHFRFNYTAKAVTGTLDVDVILYKDPVVSADGTPETIISTNDAIVKTSGVLMFHTPTVTSVGIFKTSVEMFGEKKSAGSKETSVPEWILAPDGVNARDYLMRLTNNSGGAIDFNHDLFFYDSGAV